MKRNSLAYICLSLTVICTAVALLVSGAYSLTAEKISQRERLTEYEGIRKLFPDAGDENIIAVAGDFGNNVASVCKITDGEAVVGYTVKLTSSGFGGDISMLVAVLPSCEVSGVEILSHSETPGVGAKVENRSFLEGFYGKTEKAVIGVNVDAIAGATVSSKAVAEGVNYAVTAVETLLGKNVEVG